MNYITNEIIYDDSGKMNAGSKAREDLTSIFCEEGFHRLDIPWHSLGRRNFRNLLRLQYLAKKEFKDDFSKLNNGDVLVVQFPTVRWLFSLGKLLKQQKRQGVRVVIWIHDIPSLRMQFESGINKVLFGKLYRIEQQCFDSAEAIISHNEKMNKYLISRGINEKKIRTLEIFDYLINFKFDDPSVEDAVVVAGNLSNDKAGYLKKIPKNLRMNLYGVGFDEKYSSPNLIYKGSFLPDDLIRNIKGNFGLVWDGDSIDGCTGSYGEYMKYNDPHKASLYLACGLPVIIWKKAALADFVEKNHCGIAINSISELSDILQNMSDEEQIMLKINSKKVGDKLRQGYYSKKIIKSLIII